MEKYQIVETRSNGRLTAWGKAPEDVADIAESCGYRKLSVRVHNDANHIWGKCMKRFGFCRDWMRAVRDMKPDAILLVQFPFHHRYYFYDRYLLAARKKGVRLIYMVHDVERLRGTYNSKSHDRELSFMLHYADAMIVHNDTMKDYFIQKFHVEPGKLIPLEIFDYLCQSRTCKVPGENQGQEWDRNLLKTHACAEFAKAFYIAGNLSTEKTGYLKALPELEETHFELYGINCPDELKNADNVHFNGVAVPDELPNLLHEGFGLVWDGDDIKGCSGPFGNYMRFNSPHKLSLYMAAGLPVIIWEKAAQASFVKKYGVGLTVASLLDLNDKAMASESDYSRMAKAAEMISERIRSGYYTKRALKAAEAVLC